MKNIELRKSKREKISFKSFNKRWISKQEIIEKLPAEGQ